MMLFIELQNERDQSVLNSMRVSGDMRRHVLRTFFELLFYKISPNRNKVKNVQGEHYISSTLGFKSKEDH